MGVTPGPTDGSLYRLQRDETGTLRKEAAQILTNAGQVVYKTFACNLSKEFAPCRIPPPAGKALALGGWTFIGPPSLPASSYPPPPPAVAATRTEEVMSNGGAHSTVPNDEGR